MKRTAETSIKEMTLGGRIRYYRKISGISQEALAAEILVTKQSVSQYEHDRTDMKVSTLETIACVLGVSAGSLVDGVPDVSQDANDFEIDGSEEDTMLTLFRQMSPRDRKVMIEQMKAFLKF